MYESWKWFDKAIAVYKGILSQDANNLMVKRDLALAYFQKNDITAAVKTYYTIITAPDENKQYANVKENALAEMNAIIALHKNELDISYINQNLVKMIPVDLRVTVQGNYDYNRKVQITGPGNTTKARFSESGYYDNYNITEYAIKDAAKGIYRVKVDAYNNYSHATQVPRFVRVITFKNFQKGNMEMEVKLFDLDNQYGSIELDEINW